ncbi:hypothetical protein BMY_0022 [Wohlfahrtiimonas chitiniclastica]|nr:hypothetical protein BMY_0022 [Wohlfahrtiimonas chitiniclastica]
MEEQKLIKKFIDQGVYEIENMSSKVEQTLKVLKEYRSTLITQVVTGKIDVRNIDVN